jgi:urease accessory protein UreF
MKTRLLIPLVAICCVPLVPQTIKSQPVHPEVLREEQASHFAALALKCVAREYPNKPEHVVNNEADVRSPKSLHPAFYGCYDWHSSVHGHWMLARLLKRFPGIREGGQIRTALNANLTAANIAAEVAYMKQPNRQSFERTYGWAWLLKLAEELHGWDDKDAKVWSENLKPLADQVARSYLAFLPKQNYPIRTGVHPNTAFGLAFAFDYANKVGDPALKNLLAERSRTYFSADKNYPSAWEPGGEDFFSPALMEADLMTRVLSSADFATWFREFLPEIAKNGPKALLEPAVVTDRSDPKLVHLDGLNLSRAWGMRNIADALPADDPARAVLKSAADRHVTAGLRHVASGDYAGEHWLASFAVYLLFTKN